MLQNKKIYIKDVNTQQKKFYTNWDELTKVKDHVDRKVLKYE